MHTHMYICIHILYVCKSSSDLIYVPVTYYSTTSITQTSLCQLNHKSGQISEIISPLIYCMLSLTTIIEKIHLLTKYSNRTVTTTVWIMEGWV